jgi:hypothetical protein
MMELRSVGDIRQKVKQARFRHLKRFLEDGLSQQSSNCVHNNPSEAFGKVVGVCKIKHVTCDPIASRDLSGDCGLYACRNTKESLKQDFAELMSGPLSRLASRYPDLAALAWIFQDGPHVDDFHPGSTLVGLLRGIPIWADDAESAESVKQDLDVFTDVVDNVRGVNAQLEEFDVRLTGLQRMLEDSSNKVEGIELRILDIDSTIAEVAQISRSNHQLMQGSPNLLQRINSWVKSWL